MPLSCPAPWQGTSEVSARPTIDISRLVNYIIQSFRKKLCIERRKEGEDLVLSLVTENGGIHFYLEVE